MKENNAKKRFSTKLRVRYSETDKMGFCYYGNYAQYFEVARVEALRDLGIVYKLLEDNGILLPVTEFHIIIYVHQRSARAGMQGHPC